jgi:hypothetical protein
MARMTKADWEARAEAYESAADRLEPAGDDNPVQREQNRIVRIFLRQRAEACRADAEFAPEKIGD